MSGDMSAPYTDVPRGLPQDRGREKRQPYAAEHEDYNDHVAETPKEQGGKVSPAPRGTAPRKV